MSTATARPVQKFTPTTGPALGYVCLAVCALVVAVAVTSGRPVTGLRVTFGAVLVAVLVWVALLRPRAAAYDETLVLRGMVSDTTLPLAAIDAAVVRHMLVVRIGEQRYTCAGIARSTRSMVTRRHSAGATPPFGLPRADDLMTGAAGRSGDNASSSADYATFVETRIEELARSARRDRRAAPAVRRRWAWLEITALSVTALAFALSLLVL
jgi:hypothetical protein